LNSNRDVKAKADYRKHCIDDVLFLPAPDADVSIPIPKTLINDVISLPAPDVSVSV
jgi:hypothetical protein